MKERWLLVGFILVFTFLVTTRAAVIPMTHDEASTWLSYRHYNIWGCLSDYYCWQYANNHWLNTLFLQWSANLFGEDPFALRIPNILAGLLYFCAAALLSWRYIHTPLLQLAGFLLLCGHIYLLDFFSLARGYGLMACGVLWGIYSVLRYIERYDFRWLLFSVLTLVLAVLSNFTALLALMSVGLGWFGWMIGRKKYSLIGRHGLVWVVTGVVLSGLLYYPIRTLRGSGEFDWGAASLTDTIQDLLGNLLYGSLYFGEGSRFVLFCTVSGALLFILLATYFYKQFNSRPQLVFVLFLLILNLAGIVFLQYITGSHTPVGRRSIYLIPFIFTPFALGLNLVKKKSITFVVGILISGAMIYHTIHPLSFTSCREWYYDAYYPELFASILPDEPTNDSVRLGSSWIFYPSLTYYQKTKPLPISGLEYQKSLVVDTSLHFYYVEQMDTSGMRNAGFVLAKNIGPYFLFKNSAAPSPSGPIN